MKDETKTKTEKEEDKIAEGKVRPDKGNGFTTDKYSWSQPEIKEINITIPVPSETRGKEIKFEFDAKNISVLHKGQELIKGEFFAPIKSDSLVWALEEVKDKKIITITFEKFENMKWWECLIKGEQCIDTTKIQPETSKISDIEDPEMRATVEKMMFDTRQKAQGLPTSDELGKQGMMENFMKAHPEMDFKNCKFN